MKGGGRSSSSGKSWIIEARPTNCHLLAIYRPTTRKLFRSRQATAAAPMCARLCVPDPKYGANNVKWTCRLTTSPALSSSQHHQWAVQGFGLIVSFNFAIIDRMELDENLVVSRIQLADRWCLSWYRKPANYWPCFRDNVHNTQLDLTWLVGCEPPQPIFGRQGRNSGRHISCVPPLPPPLCILQNQGKA